MTDPAHRTDSGSTFILCAIEVHGAFGGKLITAGIIPPGRQSEVRCYLAGSRGPSPKKLLQFSFSVEVITAIHTHKREYPFTGGQKWNLGESQILAKNGDWLYLNVARVFNPAVLYSN